MLGSVEAGLADSSSLSSLSLLIARPEKYNDSSPASATRQAGRMSVVLEPRRAAIPMPSISFKSYTGAKTTFKGNSAIVPKCFRHITDAGDLPDASSPPRHRRISPQAAASPPRPSDHRVVALADARPRMT